MVTDRFAPSRPQIRSLRRSRWWPCTRKSSAAPSSATSDTCVPSPPRGRPSPPSPRSCFTHQYSRVAAAAGVRSRTDYTVPIVSQSCARAAWRGTEDNTAVQCTLCFNRFTALRPADPPPPPSAVRRCARCCTARKCGFQRSRKRSSSSSAPTNSASVSLGRVKRQTSSAPARQSQLYARSGVRRQCTRARARVMERPMRFFDSLNRCALSASARPHHIPTPSAFSRARRRPPPLSLLSRRSRAALSRAALSSCGAG